MTSSYRNTLLTVIGGLFLSGCASQLAATNCERLSQENKDFSKMLRWRENNEALQRVKAEPDGPRTGWAASLQQVEVIDCSVKELTCVPAAEQAKSILTLSYIRSGSATLRTTDLPLDWHYLQTGTWLIISPPPKLP